MLMSWLVLGQTHALIQSREVRRDAERQKGDRVCDYRRRNEEWRPSIYSRLYKLMVKGDYMSKA